MKDTMTTKATIIESVKTAIATATTNLINFSNGGMLVDEELDMAVHAFVVNGVLFSTGWADTTHYSFLQNDGPLTCDDAKLLLWWLEQKDTWINKIDCN